MKDFINRLALVIHWTGFVVGVLGFITMIVGGFAELAEASSDAPASFLLSVVVFLVFLLPAWLIRYILVGKCSIYPWENNVSK